MSTKIPLPVPLSPKPLKMLSEQGYQFYDADGSVHVFDIRVEGPTETNECIAGSEDTSVTMTV
jgi:hypothetical protein